VFFQLYYYWFILILSAIFLFPISYFLAASALAHPVSTESEHPNERVVSVRRRAQPTGTRPRRETPPYEHYQFYEYLTAAERRVGSDLLDVPTQVAEAITVVSRERVQGANNERERATSFFGNVSNS
jgi:hypothetical protein